MFRILFPSFSYDVLRRAACGALLAVASAGAATASPLTLRWSDNSANESGFKVERATGTSGSFSQIGTTGANTSSYVDNGAADNATYRYRVRAYNSAGNSSYSNITTVTSSGSSSGSGGSGGGGGSSSNTAPTISSIGNRTIPVNGTTGAISFTIGDSQTSASNLSLIRNSSDTGLVPLGNITFGGSGANRTVTVKPASNKSGWATIWVKVSDGQATKYTSFMVTVQSGSGGGTTANTAPTISNIGDRTIAMNGTTGAIPFSIGDSQTSASNLTLIKNCSDSALVPMGNITFGGSGANRTVTVKPASNKTGWSTIWIKVSDGQLSRYVSFKLTVQGSSSGGSGSGGGNTAPTISRISDRTITTNGSTGSIAFTIGDGQTSAWSLSLVKNSSNSSVIPLSGISFGGSGANRTVTVRPAYNRTGWSTIWVKVSDGQMTSYTSFVVSVQAKFTYANISAPTTSISSFSLASSQPDRFRFGYIPLGGDTEITVKVASLVGGTNDSAAGLMFRESTAANAACAGVLVTGGSNIMLVSRTSTGGTLRASPALKGKAPVWLRLTRAGDTFYGFTSIDGKTWDLVEFATVNLPDTTLAGTVASAPDGATDQTASFTEFSVD